MFKLFFLPFNKSVDQPVNPTLITRVFILVGLLLFNGCAAITNKASSALGKSLTAGILNQDDPDTIRDGLPAYLILLDGLIDSNPTNSALLFSAAQLNSAYAGSFVENPERRKKIAERGFSYAKRAICLKDQVLCQSIDQAFDQYEMAMQKSKLNIDDRYAFASAWAGRIQANADNWDMLADLPKIENLMQSVVLENSSYKQGEVWMYVGVLSSLRPPALGGKPEEAKAAFEKAIALSNARNLMAKTLYAEFYARLLFEQELHDRLLNEVIAAEPREKNLTLANVLAQQKARILLESGKDYF